MANTPVNEPTEALEKLPTPQQAPLVTIVVPTLNSADYLRETLASVLDQDYQNLEILVSDNGSCDETPALVQSLINHDHRARFRRNRATTSIHEHFTQCVYAARGEFFILLCDDDRINRTFVSELVAVMRRYPDVNVVVPSNVVIDEHGEVDEVIATPEGDVFDGPEFVCQWLHGRGPRFFINVVTTLMRTAVVRQFGGYQALGGGRNIDNLLFLQCAVTGRVGFAHGAIFNWRRYSRSYGSSVEPEQVAESSRQFLQHLRRDSYTREALMTLSRTRRRAILNGVRYMTAVELVSHITFLRRSVWREIISKKVPIYRWDGMFCYVVLRQMYRRLRLYGVVLRRDLLC